MDVDRRLSAVSEKIDAQFRSTSFVYVGALFRELTQEFEVCFSRLIELSREQHANGEAIAMLTRRLCELSREMIFSADGNRVGTEIKTLITQLFRLAVEHIEQITAVSAVSLTEIRKHCGNIRKRAYASSDVCDPWLSIELVGA